MAHNEDYKIVPDRYKKFPYRISWEAFQHLPAGTTVRFTNQEADVDFYLIVRGKPEAVLDSRFYSDQESYLPGVVCETVEFKSIDPLFDVHGIYNDALVMVYPWHVDCTYYVTYVTGSYGG